eukprot:m.211194 g.211194  ORF g.211194 m.211194 type:complete len:645 (-) comp22125_c1_seq1:21-1955(-)
MKRHSSAGSFAPDIDSKDRIQNFRKERIKRRWSLLIKHRAVVNAFLNGRNKLHRALAGSDKEQAVLHAASTGSLEEVEAFFQSGGKLAVFTVLGESLLQLAVRHGHVHVAKALIEHECDVDASDRNGMTPLIEAVRAKNVNLVGLLLDSGADPAITSKDGSALGIAEKMKCPEIIARLRVAFQGATQTDQLSVLVKTGSEYVSSLDFSREVILVIGVTGSGKSTFCSAALGSSLCVMERFGRTVLEHAQRDNALPVIGHEFTSQTIYPKFYTVDKGPLKGETLCDTAGFFDSRGTEFEAVAGIFTQYVLSKAKIKGFMCILGEDALQGQRGGGMRDLFRMLRKLCPQGGLELMNLALVLTKADDTSLDELRDFLEECSAEKDAEPELKYMATMFLSKSLAVFNNKGVLSDMTFTRDWSVFPEPVSGTLTSDRAVALLAQHSDPSVQHVLEEVSMHLTTVVSVGSRTPVQGLGSRMLLGLGWAVGGEEEIVDENTLDLDLAVILRTEDGQVLDTVTYEHDAPGFHHSGDHETGGGDGGDNEQVFVNMEDVSASVNSIEVVVAVYKGKANDQRFGDLASSFVRIARDGAGVDVSYVASSLHEDHPDATAVWFVSLVRNPTLESWDLLYINEASHGSIGDFVRAWSK